MTTAKQVQENIIGVVDEVTKYKGVFTARLGYFYTRGRTANDLVQKVLKSYPQANIVDSGNYWASFKGGASLAKSSHWFVKFTLDE